MVAFVFNLFYFCFVYAFSVINVGFIALNDLTLRADNSVVRDFGMGDRSSFYHIALIGLILRNTCVRSFSYCRIQGVPMVYPYISINYEFMLSAAEN